MPPGRGEELVIVKVGRGGDAIVKLKAFDTPPPGLGLLTVTLAAPAEAISLARIEAVSFVTLLKVVARSDPFHLTVAPDTKFEPLTVRVKAGSPATAELGLSPVMAGTGFLTVRVNFLLAVWEAESWTWTVKGKIPAEVSVPLNVPFEAVRLNSGGKGPKARAQV
jgi:hypothetical protein